MAAKGGGKGLPQGRFSRRRAVAPLMQRHTGGIDHQGTVILKKKKFKLIEDPRFRQPPAAPCVAQPLCRRLFYDRLAGGKACQLTFDGMPLHGETVFLTDVRLQRQGVYPVEQLLEALRVKIPQFKIQPFGIAQEKAAPGSSGGVPPEGDPTVHRVQTLVAEGVDLLSEQAFQAEETGCYEFHFFFPFRSFFQFLIQYSTVRVKKQSLFRKKRAGRGAALSATPRPEIPRFPVSRRLHKAVNEAASAL